MSNNSDNIGDIAVIGLSGRFPGARNLDEFWRNLRGGVESIACYTDEELLAAGVSEAALRDDRYVKASAPLADVEWFDAAFFGFTPREAEITDPQQRLLLECAWDALEGAGYDTEAYTKRVGLYAGASTSGYLLHIYAEPQLVATVGAFQIEIGNDKDHLAPRASYKLNLRGPSINVQTGCSTSLVAIHLACQALLDYECDMALAGGVSVNEAQRRGYFYEPGGVRSPDGHCRAFDARAQGTVTGNGVGLVLLKRLADAIADGDHVHTVIRGSAVNNDGAAKVGYTAPSVTGQAEVITKALALAGLTPDEITYVEAHGTGTALGDPVEIAALTKSFRARTDRKGFCAVGSVKTNIGHLNAAAGVAGFIKTVLALKHRELPPSLHFEQPNPEIDFPNSPFFVNARLTPWPANGRPRRAGVSAFSIGGTNAHVVLEEAPPPAAAAPARPWQLLTLSARTEPALERMTADLREHLRQHPHVALADAAYTLHVGRRAFEHRRTVVCRDVADVVAVLETPASPRVVTGAHDGAARSVVFMFPGQGTQHVQMALELYRDEPLFKAELDRSAELLAPLLGLDLRAVLYPAADGHAAAQEQLSRTALTQPALFAVEYALAQLWLSWGVRPAAMIGHSIGEYVAACLAGVFTLEDALRLVAARGRLVQQLPGGAMLAVPLAEAEITPLLGAELSLAAVNGPSLCVVSGGAEEVAALEQLLTQRGVPTRRLQTSHAFHSRMLDPIIAEFVEQVQATTLNAPALPYISNVTGTWITAAEATAPDYWGRQLRQTVRFAAGLSELLTESGRVLLEVGPRQVLTSLAQSLAQQQTPAPLVLPSLARDEQTNSDAASMLSTLGSLWVAGVAVDWHKFHVGERRCRVPLPTYPFEREKFWLAGKADAGLTARVRDSHSPDDHSRDVADWFHVPVWKQSVTPMRLAGERAAAQPSRWLIFLDECGVGQQLLRRLEQAGQQVVSVSVGEQFARVDETTYTINPGRRADYDSLLKTLHARAEQPDRIVHLWTVAPPAPELSPFESCAQAAMRGCQSLLFLAQAVGELWATAALRLDVVSSDMHRVTGAEDARPEKSTLLGPCRVLPKEYPNLTCRSIDLTLPTEPHADLIEQLFDELTSAAQPAVVALRGGERWVQTYEPMRLDEGQTQTLRPGGVYLITGGGAGLGASIAEHLARTFSAKLIIVEDAAPPPRAEWGAWLETHGEQDELSRKLRGWMAFEECGAEVLPLKADVASASEMRAVLQAAGERFGQIHGVIHATEPPSAGLIQLKTAAASASALAPRVQGALVLASLFQDQPLDFMLFCSATTSIIAGLGQADECAANAFLDACAQATPARRDRRTLTINWAAQPPAAHVESPRAEDGQSYDLTGQAEQTAAPDPQLVGDVLGRVLATMLRQVIVSPEDFQTAVERQSALTTASVLAHMAQLRSAGMARARPRLETDYVPPRNAVENILVGIWQELFGIERIGVNDDFLALGGHSLLAIQLIIRVRDAFQVELPLHSLFTTPTVAGLAEKITEQQLTPEELAEIEELYREIEGLSADEAQQQLERELHVTARRGDDE